MKLKVSNANQPVWKNLTVKSHIPTELKKLEELSRNVWWAWNYEARLLFKELDADLWKEVGENPVLMLERMSYEKLKQLSEDVTLLRHINDVYDDFKAYMSVEPRTDRPSVAYFCMEYGLTHVLKI